MPQVTRVTQCRNSHVWFCSLISATWLNHRNLTCDSSTCDLTHFACDVLHHTHTHAHVHAHTHTRTHAHTHTRTRKHTHTHTRTPIHLRCALWRTHSPHSFREPYKRDYIFCKRDLSCGYNQSPHTSCRTRDSVRGLIHEHLWILRLVKRASQSYKYRSLLQNI